MKKTHLALVISAALGSTSLLAANNIDTYNSTNKSVSYAITAPQQKQLSKHTGANKLLAEQRLEALANIQSKVKNRLNRAGIKVTKQLQNLAAISFAELNEQQVRVLRAEGYTVEKLGYKQLVESNIQAQSTPWGIDRVRSPEAWVDYTGAGVKVCVIDTGIDYNHEDLKDVFVAGINTAGAGHSDPMDVHYHGTHVSGTIAAANNDVGVVGVAPGAGLYNVAAFDSSGRAQDEDILEGLDWCVAQGTDVVSMSYGGSSSTEAEETAYQAAYETGIVLVAAAGNDGATAPILYPGRYPQTIAVGATTESNNIASFSQRGPELDVVAPGSGVNSTDSGGGYRVASGTSMATPHVSGVAALIIAKAKADGNEALVKTEYVRDYLKLSALDLGDSGRDNTFGDGLVDARAALDLLDGGNLKPVASYGVDLNDLTVSFTNNSYDRDGTVTAVSWDFGDGNTSTDANPVHTYAAYGIYTVTLTVTDDAGDTSVSSQDINVRIIPGGALENGVAVTGIDAVKGEEYHWWLDVAAPTGEVLEDLRFAISGGSGDADIYVRYGAKPTTSTYDYRPYKGGNNEEVIVGSEALQQGRWYVMVRAYSDYSGVDLVGSYQTAVPPENVAPTAAFVYQAQGLSVTLTDTSTDSDGTVSNWLWDLGDGNSSTAQNPSHTYAADGSYTVSLTVTDDDGATHTTSQVVTVAAGSNGGGASYSNEQPLVIDDNDWLGVKSNIDVERSGDSGLITLNLKVVHEDADQLLIKLRAPDGTKWDVSRYEAGNIADGIEKTLTFDATGIDSQGTWKLYLYDRTPGVEGYLDNWTLTFPAAE